MKTISNIAGLILYAAAWFCIGWFAYQCSLQARRWPDPFKTDKVPTFKATAYCPCEKCCGEYADGIAASGKLAEGFLVAASPRIYPSGRSCRFPAMPMAFLCLFWTGAERLRAIDWMFSFRATKKPSNGK